MEKKSKIIENVRLHERDTGSAEVQIAVLDERIKRLTELLQKNPKDCSSRRGLLISVYKQQQMLVHLHGISPERYQSVRKRLKAVTAKSYSSRPRLISGGAFEMNRRSH